MKALRTLILLLVVALAGAAGAVFAYPYLLPHLQKFGLVSPADSRTAPPGERPVPTQADPQAAVTALGRLEPGSRIIQVGGPAGSRIERLGEKVKEGAWVAKDEPLAYLDSYDELLAARELAQAQLDEAKKRLKAETNFGEANIAVAKLKIRHADEVMPKQIEAQEAEVRRSKAELDKCKIDLARSAKMLADRTIPQSQHDGVALMVRQCQEQLSRNEATLENLKTDKEIKLLMGKADQRSAEAGLVRAELSAQVESLASAVKAAQARLDRAVIKAPMDGEIIKVMTRAGESVGRDPILKMGDTKTMYAIAEVYETDVRFVHPGQKAVITSSSFPGEKLTGEVERVGSLVYKNDVLGLDPAKDADSRVIEVRIRLDDSRVAAKYNFMQVDVSISRDKS
jgi:HlyD family secretion protein